MIEGYNKANPDDFIPYIVALIDEYTALKQINPNVDDIVQSINQLGRASGIHIVVFTQRPSVNVISGDVKANLPSTVCFRLKQGSDYQTVFGKGVEYDLLGHGDGICELEGKQPIRFQSPIVHTIEEEEIEIYEKIKLELGGKSVDRVKVKPTIEPIDRLKRIIIDTNETRVKELQQAMGIGINRVTDMLKQLVVEGWLHRHESRNKGYEIIVADAMVAEWRKKCDEKYGEGWEI